MRRLLPLVVLLSIPCAGSAGVPVLPPGGPENFYNPEPDLPAPPAWPFGEDFPRTSGVGRYAGGAYFWTDFIYDDNGATGVPPTENNGVTGGSSNGTYRYPLPEQANNGADIFRVGVGLDGTDTWWRVDWITLVDPNVPIAVFAIDADASAATGVAPWPANAGLSSAGLERALVISGQGAWFYDLTLLVPIATPVATLGGAHFVDVDARSFVVRLPQSLVCNPCGRSTLRAAAGLANAAGDALLELTNDHGRIGPPQTNVYNVTFRETEVDEVSQDNPFFEDGQSRALTLGMVDAFSATVDWSRLAAADTEPEPLVPGYIQLWFVTSHETGQGIDLDGVGPHLFPGRVQPYALYLPTTYDPNDATDLTINMHGAFSVHNSTLGRSPNLVRQMCEERNSICASPLVRTGGDCCDNAGFGYELDMWEMWRSAAGVFNLHPDRTILSGISGGGFASYRILLAHPEPFAATAIMLSNATEKAIVPGQTPVARFQALENLRWQPIYTVQGLVDELVPIDGTLATIADLDARGYRYRFDLHPLEGHVGFSQKDSWGEMVQFMTEQGEREKSPGHVTFVAYLDDVSEEFQLGPRGAWWVQELVASDPNAVTARVDALSHANPDPHVDVVRTLDEPHPDGQPTPFLRDELEWVLGPPPSPTCGRTLELDLENVGELRLALDDAGFRDGPPGDVDGDGVPDASDNCPYAHNPGQADRGAIHAGPPDGIGDACQCGDVTGNGVVNGQDGVIITRHSLGLASGNLFAFPCNCDVTGDGLCNGQDGMMTTRHALGLDTAGLFANVCPSFTGASLVEVATDVPSALTLGGLEPGQAVSLDGIPLGSVGPEGEKLVSVPFGAHTLSISR